MKRVKILIAIVFGVGLGWLGSTAERSAHAQVSPPVGMKTSDWSDMGEANGTQVWRFTDMGHTCYVTSSGGISCGR